MRLWSIYVFLFVKIEVKMANKKSWLTSRPTWVRLEHGFVNKIVFHSGLRTHQLYYLFSIIISIRDIIAKTIIWIKQTSWRSQKYIKTTKNAEYESLKTILLPCYDLSPLICNYYTENNYSIIFCALLTALTRTNLL